MDVITVTGKKMQVMVGMEVFVPCRNRGGHGAWVEVVKINKKTFKAVEKKGSYIPNTKWTVHKDSTFAIVERNANVGWVKHWVND